MYVVCKNILNHYPPKLELPEHSIKCVLLTKGVTLKHFCNNKNVLQYFYKKKVINIL